MPSSPPAQPHARPNPYLFGLLSWLHMLAQTWPYFRAGVDTSNTAPAHLFHWLTWPSYSLIYLLPALLVIALSTTLLPNARKTRIAIALVATVLSLLFVQADRTIYDLYNFHFNGFVINLLLTPGGIESLGGGSETYINIALIALRVTAVQTVACWLATCTSIQPSHTRVARHATAALFAALLAQSALYGAGDIRNDGEILDTAKVYPFYKRVTFRGLADRLGIKTDRTETVNATVDTQRLNYPLQPVQFAEVQRPPNIVLLVAESLRWDRLTPEIMPNTWALAQRAQHFTANYSSGNGTREGLFGMFYGLYGSYWENFLHAQRGPLLMNRVQTLDYQLDLRTGARFSYPEFNKTLFANVPLQFQHEADERLNAWQNDQANTGAVVDFIARRDVSRPFMSFLFFESTHARYNFPDSAVIAKPYLENVDYSSMSRESLAPQIGQLRNRYTNAAHWVDEQVGRIVAQLEREKLLDNTIVIVTGDHGEEFLEHGFWGHNSSFVEEQTHTPLVVSMPGMGHATIDRLTSHMDIGTTLLQALGAPADTSAYSLGRNLFDAAPRPYIVISDWHSIGLMTAEMKYRFPYGSRSTDHWQPTSVDDRTYTGADASRVLAENRGNIIDAIQQCSRFSRKPAAEMHNTNNVAKR